MLLVAVCCAGAPGAAVGVIVQGVSRLGNDLLPHGVDGLVGGSIVHVDGVAHEVTSYGGIRGVRPALEGVAVPGGFRVGNREPVRSLSGGHSLRRRSACAAVGVIGQGISILGAGRHINGKPSICLVPGCSASNTRGVIVIVVSQVYRRRSRFHSLVIELQGNAIAVTAEATGKQA